MNEEQTLLDALTGFINAVIDAKLGGSYKPASVPAEKRAYAGNGKDMISAKQVKFVYAKMHQFNLQLEELGEILKQLGIPSVNNIPWRLLNTILEKMRDRQKVNMAS